MRLIFDCNVVVSALLNDSSPSGQAVLKAKSSSVTLLLSNSVFAEMIDVLMRPKFDRYASKELRQLFLEEYEILSTKIKITNHVQACRDSKDDMYLELALSGNADCIVTGDLDLLVLNPFEHIPIITPKEFLDRF